MPPFLQSWVEETPPFPGSEYITHAVLAKLWEEAGQFLSARSDAHPEGLAGILRQSRAGWHLVGRVTFHLAENKRDPDKPFAFLATYTDALGASGKPQHLPLGRALQQFSAAGDQRALDVILSPVRTASENLPWVREMLETRQVFSALAWDPSEAWLFIRDLPALEAAGLVVKVPDWWKGGRPSRPKVEVRLDADKSVLGVGAMLQFHVSTTLEGSVLTPEELQRIRSSTAGLINLRGQWVEVDRQKLGEVMDHWGKVVEAHRRSGFSFHEGMRYLAGYQPAGAAAVADFEDTVAEWSGVVAGKKMAAALEQLRHPPPAETAIKVKAVLRPYQERGIAWLGLMQRLGLGACLADDMGLGKTLQVIALLTTPPFRRAPEPVLLVVPASLLGTWLAEFRKFAPHLEVLACHPSQPLPEPQNFPSARTGSRWTGGAAVVTTYGVLQRSPDLQQHAWQAVILDEAQAIKNPGTAQSKAVRRTQGSWKLALTGTPVENRPGDLWALFDFLNPGLLGSAAAFAASLKRLQNRDVSPGG